MEALKQIANIAGHGGLYRILKPSRAGVIVETLDDKRAKTMMGPTARVSVLNDISIYVDTDEQSIPLGDVLLAVHKQYNDELPVNAKSADRELTDFMAQAVPDYDRERVRTSDIKKLVSWYGILRQYAPELFETITDEAESATGESSIAETPPAETSITESPVAEETKEPNA